MVLQLYGVPLSQPVRAVAWACAQKKLQFQLKMCIPGLKSIGGSKHADFLKINPIGTVPAIVDDQVVVSESAAILSYLSDKHHWGDLYPDELLARAQINAYTHWHQSNTRKLSALFGPKVRPDIIFTDEQKAQAASEASSVLQSIEVNWLGEDGFIASRPVPSIADLLAYEEIATTSVCGLHDVSSFTRISAWMDRMAALEHHDEIHKSLHLLGEAFKEGAQGPLGKAIANATKAGLAKLAKYHDAA